MKFIVFILLSILSIPSFSQIKLKIHEPMRFENINTTSMTDIVVGKGMIEIYTDDLENDYGKKLTFKFPEKGLMTNKKRWLKIEKYMMEDSEKNIIIENERRLVSIYAIIDRTTLNNGVMDAKVLEGEYVGYLPIIVSQYSKIVGKKDNENIKDENIKKENNS